MGKTVDIRVPHLGDFSDVPIVEVFISPGDQVEKEDSLIALESEKAVMEIPSPYSGTIVSLAVKAGDTVSEGSLIGKMETEDQAEEAGPQQAASASGQESTIEPQEQVQEKPQAKESDRPSGTSADNGPTTSDATAGGDSKTPSPGPGPGRSTSGVNASPHASPSVRLYARELGADLTQVPGTGPKGRIRREDVQQYVKGRLAGQPGRQAAPAAIRVDLEELKQFGAVELQPLSRIKKISGPRLAASTATIPHVTHFEEADITELEQFRKQSNEKLKADGIKLTVLAFAVKAATTALTTFPTFNASLLDEQASIAIRKYHNIAIAVDTEQGLLVPVIKGTDCMGLSQIGQEIIELAEKAAAGRLSGDDLSGATFTISSLGSIGGTGFTPIINPPQVAILGLSRARRQPRWDAEQGTFVPRLILPFSLSYDHRVIDGAQAARFCRLLADELGDVRNLLL